MIDLKAHAVEFEKVVGHLKDELRSLRTGRASAALVEHCIVEAYGTPTPLQHLASISVPDAKTLSINPWDKNILKDIERALSISQLGVNPLNDGTAIRLIMPSLTEENRKSLLKILGQKAEHAKIALRGIRDELREGIQKAERAKEITEDDRYALQKDLDGMTKEYTSSVDAIFEAKEKEIMTV